MAHVAGEMQREGFSVPLLIGGATTSRVHTAVKIAPNYDNGPTVYVPDASRAVGVVTSLLSDEQRAALRRARSPRITRRSACSTRARAGRSSISLAAARANAFKPDWASYAPPVRRRSSAGACSATSISRELARYIDWGPFFQAWELERTVPGDPRRSRRRRSGAHRARRRPGDARANHRGSLADRERRRRPVARDRRSATTSCCGPTRRARRRCSRGATCGSRTSGPRASRITASPISSRRPRHRCATTPARSP